MPNYYIANWKMNPATLHEAQALAVGVAKRVKGVRGAEVVLCPPAVFLSGLKNSSLRLGAQDCFWEQEGPFTGEISPSQLRKLGCSFVILGHSERAKYLGETIEQVKAKIAAALASGLRPVVCVGENKRGGSLHVGSRLRQLLSGLNKKNAQRLCAVYEPVWAISTTKRGRDAVPSDLVAPIGEMRGVLAELRLSSVPVLYGGSVEPHNVAGFMATGLIDGVLVGGASLEAASFSALVKMGQGR